MTHCDPYPSYSRPERVADGVMHILGVAFALIGTTALLIWAVGRSHPGTVLALSVYGTAMVGSFLASACYHMTPWERARPLLRRIDHAAIYFKIAGTYTPLVVLIGSAFGYAVLGIVWALAAIGAVTKLFFWSRPGRWASALYLLMGWIAVVLIWPLAPLLPLGAVVLIVLGGVIYTAGVLVFSHDGLRFQNAIWHGFVLVASACFFAAIALGAAPASA